MDLRYVTRGGTSFNGGRGIGINILEDVVIYEEAFYNQLDLVQMLFL